MRSCLILGFGVSFSLLVVSSGCGSGTSLMSTGQASNSRGSTNLSSSGNAVGCTHQLVSEEVGCGSEDHGPMNDGDGAVATIKNADGTITKVPVKQTGGTTNTGGTTPTPAPTVATQPPAPASNIVEFHIAPGTGAAPWNSMAQMIIIPIGKTLRIINDDAVVHRMHTPGSPCPHQPANMAPGGKYDCVITKAFDPGANAPLYDHNDGQAVAPFWVKAVP